MRFKLFFTIVVFAITSAKMCSASVLLGTCTEGFGTANGSSNITGAEIVVAESNGSNGIPLFDNLWTPSQVGGSLTANHANNAEFDAAAASLTNGINDVMDFQCRPNPGVESASFLPTESYAFFNNAPGPVDFAGYNIDEIDLQLDSLSITPNTYFGGVLIGAEVDFSVTETVYGTQVPEPSMGLVAGFFMILGAIQKGRESCQRLATPYPFRGLTC